MTVIELLNSLGFKNIQDQQIPSRKPGFTIRNITASYRNTLFADFRYSESIRYYKLKNRDGKAIVSSHLKYKYPLNLQEFVPYFNEAKARFMHEGLKKNIKRILEYLEKAVLKEMH